MKRYFINVLTEILLIHECKYFLERDKGHCDAVTRFNHGVALLC